MGDQAKGFVDTAIKYRISLESGEAVIRFAAKTDENFLETNPNKFIYVTRRGPWMVYRQRYPITHMLSAAHDCTGKDGIGFCHDHQYEEATCSNCREPLPDDIIFIWKMAK
jgi:hypothetical protein